jgi:hypothetical protein
MRAFGPEHNPVNFVHNGIGSGQVIVSPDAVAAIQRIAKIVVPTPIDAGQAASIASVLQPEAWELAELERKVRSSHATMHNRMRRDIESLLKVYTALNAIGLNTIGTSSQPSQPG